jgi:PhoH-like ATPase
METILSRKIFVIDTSVLLYDKKALEVFEGNDIVLPMAVLEELDKFKEKPGVVGESARYVNRFLDSLRESKLEDGWRTVEALDLRISFDTRVPEISKDVDLDLGRNDNKIIGCALRLKKENPENKVIVITKDINLRVKCDALEVVAEDYYKDHVAPDLGKYNGWEKIEDFTFEQIDQFYANKKLPIVLEGVAPNSFIIGKAGEQKSLLGVYRNNEILPLHHKIAEMFNVEPRNSEQGFAIEALLNPNIPLVTLTGLAGSGKTFLALMAALSVVWTSPLGDQMKAVGVIKQKRLVITRTLQPVGRDLGFLPGSMQDKMAPWLAPIVDNVRQAFGDTSYFDTMVEKGSIEVAPIPYIRGRTFTDAFIIVDEAQNATIHELKTIITRVGQGSKIILLGDIDQIDTPYIDKRSNGLSIVIDRFRNSNLAAHVHLSKGQRSGLATEASSIL